MKVIYKAGPCKHKRCCPKGDTHQRVVEVRNGPRFVRGGDSVEMSDDAGKKLIADHPVFEEEGKAPSKKPASVPIRK